MCTGIRLRTCDGGVIYGRTLEFALDVETDIIFIPRNLELSGTQPNGDPSLVYRTHYAVLGATSFRAPIVFDGVNEKGLAGGAFYFETYAEYAEVSPENVHKGLSPTEYLTWILTQFSTVEEVRAHLSDTVILNTSFGPFGFAPPLHYILHDRSGACLVIEPLKGKLVTYDNPVGVFTNSPTFDWHLTNLRNYIGLTPNSNVDFVFKGNTVKPFGLGVGLFGLPGDFTPTSRFVRAFTFCHLAEPEERPEEGIQQAFHLLNNFDIPYGTVRKKEADGKTLTDYTMFTSAVDLENCRYYFKTFQDQRIKQVDLNKNDLDADEITFIPIRGETPVLDLSPSL